jgi:hypothetical protein
VALTVLTVGYVYVYWTPWWKAFNENGLGAFSGEYSVSLWLVIVGNMLGMALMFASLLVGRAEEESNPVLRRMLYGFNAFFTGYLLLCVLAVLNVLAYVYLPAVSDWTGSGIFTLADQSQQLLKAGLEKPLTVYVIVDTRSDRRYEDIRNLMDNIRNVTEKVKVEYLIRDRDPRVEELQRQFKLPGDTGVLIVYGSGPEADHQFIGVNELYEVKPSMGMGGGEMSFKGEDAVMSAIQFLEEGKAKPVIYFTQGNGELDVGPGSMLRDDEKGSELVARLEKQNYQVKGLVLGKAGAKNEDPRVVTSAKVPDDAKVVVIAGPQSAFTEDALKALHQYMNPDDPARPKGKLLALMGVAVGPDGSMVHTGVEGLLAEYGVQLGNERILATDTEVPLNLAIFTNPDLIERNPVANALKGIAFPMTNVRPVRSLRANPSLEADVLLIALGRGNLGGFVWPESNLSKDAAALVKELADKNELENKDLARALPVGVAVSESVMDPNDPHPFMQPPQGKGQKPRLIAIGNAEFVSNKSLAPRGTRGRDLGGVYVDLVTSSLAWLRERPGSIGIAPKSHENFELPKETNISRVIWLPGALMAVTIIGLGLGLWTIRRR